VKEYVNIPKTHNAVGVYFLARPSGLQFISPSALLRDESLCRHMVFHLAPSIRAKCTSNARKSTAPPDPRAPPVFSLLAKNRKDEQTSSLCVEISFFALPVLIFAVTVDRDHRCVFHLAF